MPKTWDGYSFEGGKSERRNIQRTKRDFPIYAYLEWYARRESVVLRGEPGEKQGPLQTWYSVRCPFHRDKRASASFNASLQRFKCHACEVSGDIIDLVAQTQPSIGSVREAIEWIETHLTAKPVSTNTS